MASINSTSKNKKKGVLNQIMTSSKEKSNYFSTQLTEMTNWKKSFELTTSNLINLNNNGQIKSKYNK